MAFDPDVRVGEIRIFADAEKPLTALVLSDCGLAGYRLVPVSPYCAPASDRELVSGVRVFQLWNVCTASRRFVGRSWLVDELPEAEVERIRRAVSSAGSLPAELGDYERRELAVGGSFRPWFDGVPTPVPLWRTWRVWSMAAMLMIGLGVVWLVWQEPVEGHHANGYSMTVGIVRAPMEEAALEELSPCEDADRPDELPTVQVAAAVPPPLAKAEPVPRVCPAEKTKKFKRADSERASRRVCVIAKADTVVAANARAGAREAEVMGILMGLKAGQRPDGSWGKYPLKDTALAVLALMAHGETSKSAVFGETLTRGVRWLCETSLKGAKREDAEAAACALCCASVSVRNPNIRTAAERALEAIGDRRSVEAGRDWSGLLVDLTRDSAEVRTRLNTSASSRPDDDAIASDCIFVLKLLKK